MKQLKKRVTVLLAALMLCTALIPSAVLAEEIGEGGPIPSVLMSGGYTEEELTEFVSGHRADDEYAEGDAGKIYISFLRESGQMTPAERYEEISGILETVILPEILPLLGDEYKLTHTEKAPTGVHIWVAPELLAELELKLFLLASEYGEYSFFPVCSIQRSNTEIADPGLLYDSVKGDVNGDGKIDSIDYIMTKRYVLRSYTATAEQIARMDVNEDGESNGNDYIILKRYVLKTISRFPEAGEYPYISPPESVFD